MNATKFTRTWASALELDPANRTVTYLTADLANALRPGDFLLAVWEERDSPHAYHERSCGQFVAAGSAAWLQVEGTQVVAQVMNERVMRFGFGGNDHPTIWPRVGQPVKFDWSTTIQETVWDKSNRSFSMVEVPFRYNVTVDYFGELKWQPHPVTADWLHANRAEAEALPPPVPACRTWPSY